MEREESSNKTSTFTAYGANRSDGVVEIWKISGGGITT
jgi:hypothetical protein